MIKFEEKKVISVQDWDKLVEETYSRPYNLQQQDNCMDRQRISITIPLEDNLYEEEMNDSIPEVVNGQEMGVKFNVWLDRDPEQKLKGQNYDWELRLFWERNFYPLLDSVVNDLYKKGLLEQGEYEIDIDW